MSDEFVSVAQAAQILTLSPWTVRQWLSEGRLQRFKAGRRTILLKSDVLAQAKLETKDAQTARNVEREQRQAAKAAEIVPQTSPIKKSKRGRPRQTRVSKEF